MQTAARCAEATWIRSAKSLAGERVWRSVAHLRGSNDRAESSSTTASLSIELVAGYREEHVSLYCDSFAPAWINSSRNTGNEAQWLPSASCSSDRAPFRTLAPETRPLELESAEPRISNLAWI